MGSRAAKEAAAGAEAALSDDAAYAEGRAVRVVVISDTHNQVSAGTPVPAGDVLVHCGDFTEDGTVAEARAFNAWLGAQPHRHRVVLPGNHDLFADLTTYAANVRQSNRARRTRHLADRGELPDAVAAAAHDGGDAAGAVALSAGEVAAWEAKLRADVLSAATVYTAGGPFNLDVAPEDNAPVAAAAAAGRTIVPRPATVRLRLAAAPHSDVIRISSMRAFSRDEAAQADAFARLIPADAAVDVLVTHSPPRGVLDSFLGQHTGSQPLADVLAGLQRAGVAPRLHVFGHVHKQRGVVAPGAAAVGAQGARLPGTTFVNAAAVAGHALRPRPAVVIDVPLDALRSCDGGP